MNIPHIYIYFGIEIFIVLIVITILLFLKNRKLLKLIEKLRYIIDQLKAGTQENKSDPSDNQYIEYLKQEAIHNQERINYLDKTSSEENEEDKSEAQQQNETRKKLLIIRNDFIQAEIAASELKQDENRFWQSQYKTMQDIFDKHFSHTEEIINKEEIIVNKIVKESKDTYIQIEPQKQKIDTEVNKLKDIIYEQENSISALSKALKQAAEDHTDKEFAGTLGLLNDQLNQLERNMEESRTCIEILETENERLQEELINFSNMQQVAGNISSDTSEPVAQPSENVEQLKASLEQQDQKIEELLDTVNNLELEAQHAEKLRTTLQEFTRNSQEMMGCITILEEENERLLQEIEELKNTIQQLTDADDEELQQKLTELEQALIKKDVEYAKLQDNYSALEKQYLDTQ